MNNYIYKPHSHHYPSPRNKPSLSKEENQAALAILAEAKAVNDETKEALQNNLAKLYELINNQEARIQSQKRSIQQLRASVARLQERTPLDDLLFQSTDLQDLKKENQRKKAMADNLLFKIKDLESRQSLELKHDRKMQAMTPPQRLSFRALAD